MEVKINDYAAERVQEGGRQLAGDASDLIVRQGKKLARSARGKRGTSDGSEPASEPDDSGEGVSSPEPETKPAGTPEQHGVPIEPEPEPYYESAPVQPESDFQQVSREYPAPRHELPNDAFGIKTREAAQSQLPSEQRSTESEQEEITSPPISSRSSTSCWRTRTVCFGQPCFTALPPPTTPLSPWRSPRSATWAANPIGPGTVTAAEWNGARSS